MSGQPQSQASEAVLKEISPKCTVHCLAVCVGTQQNMLRTVTFVERYP